MNGSLDARDLGLSWKEALGRRHQTLWNLCGKSATKLVSAIACHFPGFRDHTVYKGHQVFLNKRAQIFAADVWVHLRVKYTRTLVMVYDEDVIQRAFFVSVSNKSS